MLRELYAEPERGFLGAQTFLYWRGVAMLQYWRSFEDLERFARDCEASHLPAWRRFNRSVGSDGAVGIWHETFMAGEEAYEAIYVNIPGFSTGLMQPRTSPSPETTRRCGGVSKVRDKGYC